MKLKEHIRYYRCLSLVGLTIALILKASFVSVIAQISKPQIITSGADSTLERTLAQPEDFWSRLGVPANEFQHFFGDSPRILIRGAGSVRVLESKQILNELIPLNQQNYIMAGPSSISVIGAGSVFYTGLTGLALFTDSNTDTIGILVVDAGAVQVIDLQNFNGISVSQSSDVKIEISDAGSVSSKGLESPNHR